MGEGKKQRHLSLWILLFVLIGSQIFSFQMSNIEPAWAQTPVTIEADGSTTPSTAPISSLDKITYTLTGDLANSYLVIQRNNIAVDGAGYTATGPGDSTGYVGIMLSGRTNVTIKNIKVQAFSTGIQLVSSSNCQILSNVLLKNKNGLAFWGSCYNNLVSRNTIRESTDDAVQLLNMYNNNNIFSENTLSDNTGAGFLVMGSNLNVFFGNNVTNSADYYGNFYIFGSNSTVLTGNRVEGRYVGIYVRASYGCTLSQNNIVNARWGIDIESSSNLTLKRNVVSNCTEGFVIWSDSRYEVLEHFMHNIEDSNTIDGKPICYWTNEDNKTVPKGAGFIGLANCTNITVQDQNVSKNGIGILLAFTQNSTIYSNYVSDCEYGIHLVEAVRNRIVQNNLFANGDGIFVGTHSTLNDISGNDVSYNTYGMEVDTADQNAIYGNNLEANRLGINFYVSNSNMIYKNNFINENRQVSSYNSVNSWDSGYPGGGNYWREYQGSDANNDGIGDTPHIIDDSNQDNFPLMNDAHEFTPPGLTAFFSYRIDYANNNVTFDASGSFDFFGSALSYTWDFGDEQSATGMTVSHVYNFSSTQLSSVTGSAQAGSGKDTYDATLTVTNNKGSSKSQTRKVGIGNLLFSDWPGGPVHPMQAFQVENELIHSETTHFIVYYDSTFKVPVSANIKLEAPGFTPNSIVIRNAIFKPGIQNEIILKSNLLPSEKSGVQVRAILDPENAIGETNETDNVSEFSTGFGDNPYRVNDTKPLGVLFVPVRFDDEDGYPGYFAGYSRGAFEQHAHESGKYMRATFPVADSEISYGVGCFNSPVNAGKRPVTKAQADATLESLLSKLAARAFGAFDRVVGVVRTNWFDGIPGWSGTLGYMYTTCPTACVVTLGNWKVTAHELGHTFDLDENNKITSMGYYAAAMRELSDTQTWMSTGAIANPPAQPTYRVAIPGFWIMQDEYEHVIQKWTLPGDPQLLFFSGTFFRNGTMQDATWHRIPDGVAEYVEGGTGNYSLVQLSNTGTVTSTVRFNVTFEKVVSEHPDYLVEAVPVSFTVPFSTGTKTIQIRNSVGAVVASKTVSTNTPTISVSYPNGGEILAADHIQVSWSASDVDGDSLVYGLEVSGDGGLTWDPVAAGLTQTTHNLILTGFKGGNKYLVRVTASDGVNTAKDISNSYFTIASFSVNATSNSNSVQQGGKAYVLLNVTSFGSFSNSITLGVTCSNQDQFNYKWVGNSIISPRVNGYLMAVLEVTFNTTQTGVYTLYLSGSSGNNTEVSAVDFLVETSEGSSDTIPPIANAGQNQTVTAGTTVNFNGSASNDNIGIVNYAWNFGDGGTGNGATATHTYTNVGNYTVTLTVADAAGNTASSTVRITVQSAIPEFSPATMLTALVIFTLALTLVLRKKQKLCVH